MKLFDLFPRKLVPNVFKTKPKKAKAPKLKKSIYGVGGIPVGLNIPHGGDSGEGSDGGGDGGGGGE